MGYRIAFIVKILLLIILIGCSGGKDTTITKGETIYFYTYEFNDDKEILKSDKLNITEPVPIETALDTIVQRLSAYYSRSSNEAGVILFHLNNLNIIKTNNKDYRIAEINIVDNANTMERKYFQGSTGGRIAQNTILLNLLQPQIDGFIDGIIILINGEPVKEMDHIDLRGIKVPGSLHKLLYELN